MCVFTKRKLTLVFLSPVFKNLQKESEFQRKEWFRKQGRRS